MSKINYKGYSIPKGKTLFIWKALIDDIKITPKTLKETCRKKINPPTFYTIKARLKAKMKLSKKKQYTPNVEESLSDEIRNLLARNPEMTHHEFEEKSGRKVTSSHYSVIRSTFLKGKKPSKTGKRKYVRKAPFPDKRFRTGTNQILKVIDMGEFKGMEDKLMDLLKNSFLPAISTQTRSKLEVVRLHDPAVIELRAFNR